MSYIKVTRSGSKKKILIPMSSILEIQDNLIIQDVGVHIGHIEIDEAVADIEEQILGRESLKRMK